MSFIEWKDIFDDIFEAYPDKWTLTCVHRNNRSQYEKLQKKRQMPRTRYARYVSFASFLFISILFFCRFHCSKCSNNWASAKAMVILYYPNSNESLGKVTLRFFGQQCRRCSRNNFVDPEFDEESIKLTLEKLYERIGWNCYGEERPPKMENNNDKKNNIQGPHETNLCEACQLGCCDQILTKTKHTTS